MSTRQIISLVAALLSLAVFLILFSSGAPSSNTALPTLDLELQETIDKGKYLALAGNCASCHTAEGGEFMAGGLPFKTPFGTLYSTNITPEPNLGIGSWSERDFINSMRHGVRPNGEHLYPAFPYTAFTKIKDADLLALFAYLKSLPARSQNLPENDLAFPFNIRSLMAFWKVLFFKSGAFEIDETQSEQWNRGAYLVEGLSHCSACHSPRNFMGAEKTSLALSGGEYLDQVHEQQYRPWSAPNLTATDRGLGLWSNDDLEQYLQTGRNAFLESFGPMNEVIINSTAQLTEVDIKAMAVYLESQPAINETAGIEPDAQIMGRGRTVYNLHCGTCHLPTGEGDAEMAPKLNSGSLVVQSDNPASMINAILYSPKTPGPPLLPKWRHPMDEFQYLLDDQEIAAVATFVRNSWSNSAGIVTPEQVARQR